MIVRQTSSYNFAFVIIEVVVAFVIFQSSFANCTPSASVVHDKSTRQQQQQQPGALSPDNDVAAVEAPPDSPSQPTAAAGGTDDSETAVDDDEAKNRPAQHHPQPPATPSTTRQQQQHNRPHHQQPLQLWPADQPPPRPVKVRQCEPIRIDLCAGLGYNVTGFPNLVGHDTAADAEQQLRTFAPLIQYECSSHGELRLFLCAVYVPMCSEQFPDVIGPCRSVCERVRNGCEPVLQNFGFPWPAALQCDRFRAQNDVDDQMCMEGPALSTVDSSGGFHDDGGGRINPFKRPYFRPMPPVVARTPVPSAKDCKPSTVGNATTTTPAAPHDAAASTLIKVWTIVWSSAAILSAMFGVLTFAVDAGRYSHADRVVLLAATCSAVCAVGHLSRLFVSLPVHKHHPVAPDDPCPPDPVRGASGRSTVPSGDCTLAFVVVFYFAAASSLWWLALVVIWAVRRRRSGVMGGGESGRPSADSRCRRPFAVSSNCLSTWFHVVCWSMPTVATVALLVRRDVRVATVGHTSIAVCRVDADVVGSAIGLVVMPQVLLLTLGVVAFTAGLIAGRRRTRHGEDEAGAPAADAREIQRLKQQQQQPCDEPPTTTDQHRDASTSLVDPAAAVVEPSARIVAVIAVGAVSLAASVAATCYELAAVQTQPATAEVVLHVVRVASSVLLAVIVGPWLVLSGRASASWGGFVVRRWKDRKAAAVVVVDRSAKQSGDKQLQHQQSACLARHDCLQCRSMASGDQNPTSCALSVHSSTSKQFNKIYRPVCGDMADSSLVGAYRCDYSTTGTGNGCSPPPPSHCTTPYSCPGSSVAVQSSSSPWSEMPSYSCPFCQHRHTAVSGCIRMSHRRHQHHHQLII